MADETFSFRWGIPLLDHGDTRIPNFILDNYTRAGVSRVEFLTIVHLARFQFESADACCKPSVGRVARAMGYSSRSVQRILADLEKRGLLVRHYRAGETTIYDFSGFNRAVLEVKLSTGGDVAVIPQSLRDDNPVRGRGDTSVMGGVTTLSPKEEKRIRKAEEEKEAAAGLPVCSVHHVTMERREKDGAIWFSHRLADGAWCKGRPGDVKHWAASRRRYENWASADALDSSDERRARYARDGVFT